MLFSAATGVAPAQSKLINFAHFLEISDCLLKIPGLKLLKKTRCLPGTASLTGIAGDLDQADTLVREA